MTPMESFRQATAELDERGYAVIQYAEETVQGRDYCWSIHAGNGRMLALSRVYDLTTGRMVTWELWQPVATSGKVEDYLSAIRGTQ